MINSINHQHHLHLLRNPYDSQVYRNPFNGNITLQAGIGNDQINVSKDPLGMYHVNVNGKDHTFTQDEFKRLQIRGGAGNDSIRVDRSVDLPVRVDGQSGNDRILNHADGSKLEGGSGNDRIINLSNRTTVAGGLGNDSIYSRGSQNRIDGGFGNDSIASRGSLNDLRGGFGNDAISSRGSLNSIQGGWGHDSIYSRGFGNQVSGGPGFDSVHSYGPGPSFLGSLAGAAGGLSPAALSQLSQVLGGLLQAFPGGPSLPALPALPFPPVPLPSPFENLYRPNAGFGFGQVDLAPGHGDGLFSKLFDPQRRAAMKLEEAVRTNPFIRSALEGMLGGQILPDRNLDGKLTVLKSPLGPAGMFGGIPGMGLVGGLFESMSRALGGLNPSAGPAGLLGGLLGGAGPTGWLGGLLGSGSPFPGVALGGLGQLASSLLGGPGGKFGFGQLPGAGAGSMNPLARPGLINNSDASAERAHQGQVDSVLNDPSLTVEDKVMLMLMLVMKKMDKDIENQSQYINQVQQQQGNKGQGQQGGFGKVAGGFGQTPGQEGAPSIDLETQKLQRMVTKRSQMFDTLKAIMDKYNETAKGVIQSMGR
ncbi:MAG: hypothetical protein HY791_28800 [Deltaproteobacteria bacterium]|nr:hypothetical protein [Deltaproteobacteria bacterium]